MSFSLQPGRAYRVRVRGQSRACRRIFKWTEQRFGSIPCYVFTSQVAGDVRGAWDPDTKSLTLTGRRLPASELSVPEYDLISAECL